MSIEQDDSRLEALGMQLTRGPRGLVRLRVKIQRGPSFATLLSNSLGSTSSLKDVVSGATSEEAIASRWKTLFQFALRWWDFRCRVA